MNERISKLRKQSLDAPVALSAERAQLITRYYREAEHASAPIQRALAFRYLMERKTVCILDHELIVGERGPAPKATPSYPEICCHSLEDLDLLRDRPKNPYAVDPATRRIYETEIIPFWRGRSMREKIFSKMSEDWRAAYECGIFTEFMEQRAPGHTVLDDKIYHRGFIEFIDAIDRSLTDLKSLRDEDVDPRRRELSAMRIVCEALIVYAERHARKARELAASQEDPARRAELEALARVCSHVPARRPETFHEALQYYWFVHLGVITELNPWDAFNPGRLDQHLLPFYRKGLEEGSLTEETARELLQCLWVKFNNHPAPPKVGVTAAESSTYTDFANINTGGLNPDGSDGVNDVTYLILDVIDEMRLVQPSSNIQLSAKNPDHFLKRACRIVRQGWGQPSMFNADVVVAELVRQGKTLEDARAGGTSGCVETGAFGKESYILTGYFNLPKILEITLHNGVDPGSGRRIGIASPDPNQLSSFEDLMEAFGRQLHHFIEIKVTGNDIIERLYAEHLPVPFLSVLIDDCVARGVDYNAGGARYNTTYIQGVGLGTLTDSLSAIRHHIFVNRDVTWEELLTAIRSDFRGTEPLRQILRNKTPRYGNDDDRADDVLRAAFEIFHDAVNGRSNTKGGHYRINLLPTTCHVYFGSVTGATPDGRKAGTPLSEGISPVQGADRLGPTAVLKSASKIDHVRTGGTLLNQKFTPDLLKGERGIDNLASLVRTYFKLGGHHIQFNVIRAETLRAAQEDPDGYRDLIVRVAGYSDYFCELSKTLQDEIIARTEHGVFRQSD